MTSTSKIIENKTMRKKSKISQEDIATFQEAMNGVTPLKNNKKVRLKTGANPRKLIKPVRSDQDDLPFSEAHDIDEVDGETFISYKQTGISNKSLRKLSKGQYNVDAILDLHGKSIEEAIKAVNSFLQQCLREGIRVVLIIHGKGRNSQMPILKNKLNLWLRELNAVLAFCSAAPTHGSRGAIYVLLKRNTEEIID
jgi:DNA-nicking Smr family endonuclease